VTVDLLDRADLDTWLAWLLLREGRMPRAALGELLQDARRGRPAGGPSLARSLVSNGLMPRESLEELLRAGAVAPTRDGEAVAASAPRRLGDYELLDELGAGGMGVVYRARHVKTGALCALKVLSDSDPELVLRFHREGEGQARVDEHPHVVRVHALGVEAGRCYLAMDLAQGGSLGERLRRGPAAPEEAARWIRDLAGAVDFAHQMGVLHRDLKPENVLFDDQGVPKLVDFGLAKLLDAKSLTATGTMLGTPAYMAPEQVDGSRGAVGPAADVYGLGATLYHCLTGAPPFSGGSIMLTMLQVLEDPPPSIRDQNPEVSPGLEAVCMRALAKAPGDRFPSAAALAEAIDQALAGREAPVSRARTPWLAATAVVAGCLGVLWWAGSSGERAAPSDPPPAQSVERPPVTEAQIAPPESDPGLPLIMLPDAAKLPQMREPHSLDFEMVGALAAAERWEGAVDRFRAILSAPLTQGTLRVMCRLGTLYAVELDDPAQSRSLLARAALAGEGEAAGLLANHYLAPGLRSGGLSYGSWDQLNLTADRSLAAAGLQLTLAWCRQDRPVFRLAKEIQAGSLEWPTTREAYERLWEAFPEARQPLRSMPVPDGPRAMWAASPREWAIDGWLERASEVRTRDEAQATRLLQKVLISAASSRHARAYRELAGLRRSDPDLALHLLARSALIGDQRAAAILAAALDPDHAADLPEEDRAWDLGLAPDPELAGACRILATEEDRAARTPAYQQLWIRIPEAR
jgi:Protein kinase domain